MWVSSWFQVFFGRSSSLFCGLRLILVYPSPQLREADLTLTYRLWISFELSWWTRFNGSAKTYADWVWYSLYIGELSQPFISRICCKGYDGSMADIKARSRCTCSITMRLWNCVNKWYIHSKPHRSVRHLASVWGAIHYVRKLVWGRVNCVQSKKLNVVAPIT